MKSAAKILSPAFLILLAFLLSACSGVKVATIGGGGGTTGPFTISAAVSGLSTGNSVVLADNGTDQLTFTTNTTTAFAVAIADNGAYAVTVLTQPTSQTCTVASGSGKATANVTVAVTCAIVPVTATIGGNVTGLVNGSSVILQDNGGDSLTIIGTGAGVPFTFKTPVTGPTDAYAVTVLTQPTNPLQICTVANGSGTATANVTNVAVSCVLAYTIGGTVTGLVGTGLILQNTGAEQLPISATNGNQAFTFKNPVPTGFAYTVTIFAQPTGPAQTCVVTPSTASGTATANVTSVVVTCPAVTYSVGGTVVGLQGIPPNNGPLTDSSFVVQNNLGNSLIITQNGPFTFATPEALDDQFHISVFHGPSTQSEGCTLWNYKGVVTASITDIVIDCAHNDWTWIDGTKTAGTAVPVTPQYGSFTAAAPTTTPNPFTNTPGARYGAVGWTDSSGSLFLFGGDGWELSGNPSPDSLNSALNDLWVCDMSWGDYCQWQLVGGYDPTSIVVNGTPTTVGAQIILNAQHEGAGGYGSTPFARLGAAAWTDASGNFWLFGGSDGNNFLCDIWMYNHSGLNPANYTTAEGQWTFIGGIGSLVDQPGNYTSGTLFPGSRTNPVTWTDSSGNLWLFGGYGYDGQNTLGYLNDLWEFNTTTRTWTFVSGGNTNNANQNGIYGTQGTAASTNAPGGRQEAVGWADASGNLWLFGGEGEDSVGTADGILNDLWVYNIASKQWTWVTGSSTANQTGVYGLQPLVGPPNTIGAAGTVGLTGGTAGTLPGSRWGASGWTDNDGDLWLFGGWGLDSTATNGNGALNDFWVYTPNTTTPTQPGTWTWIKGSNTGSQNGQYGVLTRPYLTYNIWTPGGRSNATHWVDGNGQLWLFGGEGYDSTSTTGNGYLNDLWRYLPYQD
ncbi:MAG: kelch repeat-containing protein [Candidatus Acidiferrum sp.]